MNGFPFEVIAVPGNHAIAEFDRLRRAGRGSPVIVGDDDSLGYLAEVMTTPEDPRQPAEILATANALMHPQSMERLRADELKKIVESLARREEKDLPIFRDPDDGGRPIPKAELRRRIEDGTAADLFRHTPPLGDWPASPDGYIHEPLSMLRDYRTASVPTRLHIALIPTADWTEIPAHLHWGGWNGCPPAEYHVAAFRSRRDRYGAELVVLAGDKAEMRASRRPQSREEALSLAREFHVYDTDATEPLSALAASLMAGDWWGFWWD